MKNYLDQLLPDNLSHDPEWHEADEDSPKELDFGEAPKAVRLTNEQFQALAVYGD